MRYHNSPEAVANAKRYRELLDKSEAATSDFLEERAKKWQDYCLEIAKAANRPLGTKTWEE